jgi:hypothetical protein
MSSKYVLSDVLTNIYAFLISPMLATRPAYPTHHFLFVYFTDTEVARLSYVCPPLNLFKHSGYYMYHLLKILKLGILPKVYLNVSYGSHNNSIDQLVSLVET